MKAVDGKDELVARIREALQEDKTHMDVPTETSSSSDDAEASEKDNTAESDKDVSKSVDHKEVKSDNADIKTENKTNIKSEGESNGHHGVDKKKKTNKRKHNTNS